MSYLQLDLTAFDQLSALTFRAGLADEDRAIGGLTRLWLQCWRAKTATVDLIDICVAFRVRSQDQQAADMLLDALEAYGFIKQGPDGDILVRGAEKRLGLLRARQKAAAHMRGEAMPQAPEAPISPAEAIPKPVPGQVAQEPQPAPAQDQPIKGMKPASETVKRLMKSLVRTKESNGSVESRGDGQDESRNQATTVSTQPTAPVEEAGQGAEGPGSEHQQLVDAISASYLRIKRAKYAWTGRDFTKLKELKTMGTPLEIVARWEQALQTEGFRGCTAVYELPGKWNAHPMEWQGPAEDFDQRPTQEKKVRL